MESSRTDFEVLGLEALSPRKLACIFWIVKIWWSAWKIFWNTFFCRDRLKNLWRSFFFFWRSPEKFLWRPFFFGEHLRLVLGLEHSCPWPRECLSSERLSLASDFFCVLGLEPCVLDSTSAYNISKFQVSSLSGFGFFVSNKKVLYKKKEKKQINLRKKNSELS